MDCCDIVPKLLETSPSLWYDSAVHRGKVYGPNKQRWCPVYGDGPDMNLLQKHTEGRPSGQLVS